MTCQFRPLFVDLNVSLTCEPAPGSLAQTSKSVPSGAAENLAAKPLQGIGRLDHVAPASLVSQKGVTSVGFPLGRRDELPAKYADV
jgi:hypothetical protein